MSTPHTHASSRAWSPARPPGAGLAIALAAGALALGLTGCSVTLTPSGDPQAGSTEAAQPTSAAAQPAQTGGAFGSPLEAESAAVVAWQDRWYDNFCSSVTVSMGDENCVGIAVEAVEFAVGAPARATGFAPGDALGDDLRTSAEDVAAAAEAFLASECDTAQTDGCVTPTDDLTDALRSYGEVLAESLAAS